MTDEFKMEFIGGEVILHSPERNWHLCTSATLFVLLRTWVSLKSLGLVHREKALCIFLSNDDEPDIIFFGPEKAALIPPDTVKLSLPEFIFEITWTSTEDRDRGVKFQDYADHGASRHHCVGTLFRENSC